MRFKPAVVWLHRDQRRLPPAGALDPHHLAAVPVMHGHGGETSWVVLDDGKPPTPVTAGLSDPDIERSVVGVMYVAVDATEWAELQRRPAVTTLGVRTSAGIELRLLAESASAVHTALVRSADAVEDAARARRDVMADLSPLRVIALSAAGGPIRTSDLQLDAPAEEEMPEESNGERLRCRPCARRQELMVHCVFRCWRFHVFDCCRRDDHVSPTSTCRRNSCWRCSCLIVSCRGCGGLVPLHLVHGHGRESRLAFRQREGRCQGGAYINCTHRRCCTS